jgi:hypothetical protein
MTGLDKQITALELRLTKWPDVQTAIALALRCWWAYKNADVLSESAPDTKAYLHKAHHTAVTALRKNESHVRLYMLTIFIAIEADRFDNANDMLDTAMGYRSFLRANEPFYYAVLRFLYAYLEIKQKRVRSARKHIRALEEHISAAEPHPGYSLMQGMLFLAFYEYDKAYSYLTHAWENGCQSLFLYQSLYQYYRTSVNAPSGSTLLPVINWAAAHQLDVADIIGVYPDELRTAILKNPELGERIYQNASHPFILREICAGRMMKADFSHPAYLYYREAERRQINLNGLYTFLVKAAYENKSGHVNHYAMTEFFRLADDRKTPMETGLAIYVYHMLLTDPVLTDLVAPRRNAILKLAVNCLERGVSSREANSLYLFYWEQCNLMGISGEWVDKAGEILCKNITRFEITASPEVRFIYVAELEVKAMATYELKDADKIIIEAVGSDIRFTCLSAGRKSILSEQLQIKRMISPVGFALYRHFFKKGKKNFYLLAFLANHYLEWLNGITETETEPEALNEAIQIFETIIKDGNCAKSYRMRILAALGRLHYAQGRFTQALEYYGAVDENELDDACLEQILHVFLQTHEWNRVISLVVRRGSHMERQALFEAVKLLSVPDMASFHSQIAPVAFDLLINGCYSPDLLSIVLAHFQGSQGEWQELSQALHPLSVTAPQLDEKILSNSLWMCKWDSHVQKAFVRLTAGSTPAAGLPARFVEYCTYEMLANGTRPEYDTLNILEQAYLNSKDNLLAWALCHVYLRHNITTFRSESIQREAIQSQEEAGILFPVFRENRGGISSAYIEKNQPFIYKGLPDKDVWLYYKIDDNAAYSAQRMDYLRFGLYLTALPLFYNETLTYYFSEEMPTGSITTKEASIQNEAVYLHHKEGDDIFFTINNAVIYEQMFKYEQVEKIITGLVKDVKPVRSGLL